MGGLKGKTRVLVKREEPLCGPLVFERQASREMRELATLARHAATGGIQFEEVVQTNVQGPSSQSLLLSEREPHLSNYLSGKVLKISHLNSPFPLELVTAV